MTTGDFSITLFCEVDEQMRGMPKHPHSSFWPSEVVTWDYCMRSKVWATAIAPCAIRAAGVEP